MIVRLSSRLTSLLILIITLPTMAIAGAIVPWSCKVVGVSDDDTITVKRQGRGVKVRLAEIGCPEKRQPFGTKAKQFTSDHCFGKIVTAKPTDIDRYGRIGQRTEIATFHSLSQH